MHCNLVKIIESLTVIEGSSLGGGNQKSVLPDFAPVYKLVILPQM